MSKTAPLADNLTMAERYDPAMHVEDQGAADAYFERLVESCMLRFGKSRDEAEDIERSNLGYYAGYYSDDTRARVERLFRCAHPVFGAIAEKGPPTPEEAFALGVKAGKAHRHE